MGGGDLNLKKSWHPSTMKNMEKVWKAEQQNDQERKRIAELKKEIEMEKNREDTMNYAIEQGVIEKKGEKKLDWMYKGPNQTVNREDYLLGKPVDKAFEQMAQAEKEAELNRAPKNHVEYECIPPSLRFFSGTEQVDLARKMQEDPLYAIKKKEIETRSQLLKNPVKLKQLRELLEQQTHKSKNDKKKKKSKHNDSSDDEAKLDMLLVAKYKKLKDNINEKDLLKSMKKKKHKRKKSKKHSQDFDSNSCNSDNEDTFLKEKQHKRQKKRKRNINDNIDSDSSSSSSESDINFKEENNRNKHKKYSYDAKVDNNEKQVSEKRSSTNRNLKYERSKRYREDYTADHKQRYNENNKQRERLWNKYSEQRYSAERRNDERKTLNTGKTSSSKISSNTGHTKFEENKREEKWKLKSKSSLTEKEKEQCRLEMMANAVWRDKEREKHVKMHREEEKREAQNYKSYNKDFIRKQLIVATEVGTVASRIKANINNIQRSSREMDKNFAKR